MAMDDDIDINQLNQRGFSEIDNAASYDGALTSYKAMLKNSEHRSATGQQVNFLSGPYMGIACFVTITNATTEITGPFGEMAQGGRSDFRTYKLRVWVPEMNANACVPTILPGEKGWEAEGYRDIHQLPLFIGEQTVHNSDSDVKVGDVVVVDYYDTNQPQNGGKYLGRAFDKKRKWRGGGRRAKKAFRDQATKELLRRVIGKRGLGEETNPAVSVTKTCKKGVKHALGKHHHRDLAAPPFLPSSDDMFYGPGCFGDRRILMDLDHLVKYRFVDPDRPLVPLFRTSNIVKIPVGGLDLGTAIDDRVLHVHKFAELAFRMVFKQLEIMRNMPSETGGGAFVDTLQKFEIKTMGTIRNANKIGHACIRTERFKGKKGEGGIIRCHPRTSNPKTEPAVYSDTPSDWPRGYSMHTFGYALDLNSGANPRLKSENLPTPPLVVETASGFDLKVVDTAFEPTTIAAQEGLFWYLWLLRENPQEIPDIVIAIFKYYGFKWGGHYRRKDLHHFEFVGDYELMITSYVKGVLYAFENSDKPGVPYYKLLIIKGTKQPNGEEIWNTALKEAAAKKGHHRFGFEI